MNVVVVGGGFAGVKAALELSKRHVGKITLISDENYFLHHATLYATAVGRNVAESVIPLKDIFADSPSVTVIKDEVISIDPAKKLVISSKHNYHYDKVIFALGSVTSYFGIKGLAKHAYGIKSLEGIKHFKEHIHAEVIDKKLDKEYFVIGAGATGVELAGALQEHINYLKHAYHLETSITRVTLVEAAPRILPHASKTASKIVSRRLKKLGIMVLTDHKVDALSKDSISIEGKQIPTTTAVWTSGVTNHPFFVKHAQLFQLARAGRVDVNPYLQAAPNIYIIGDNNTVKYSGTAWSAMRQSVFLAKHLSRVTTRQTLKRYRPRSVMFGLPVGSNWGYVEWFGLYVAGRSGSTARRLMELYGYCQLVSFKRAVATWRAHDLPQVDE